MTVPGEPATTPQQTDGLPIGEVILKDFLVCCSFLANSAFLIQNAVPETKEK